MSKNSLNIYLAGRYGRRSEMMDYASDLTDKGHIVTSRWLDGAHENDETARAYEAGGNPVGAAQFALDDVNDVLRASVVISFTEVPRPTSNVVDAWRASRGGRHVEFGMALALHKRVIVVGPRENVFHLLPEVEHYSTWPECLASL